MMMSSGWASSAIFAIVSSVGGPADGVLFDGVIQEIDIATGKKLFEWRARDHVTVDESYAPLPEGARLFNTSVATGRSLAELAAPFEQSLPVSAR